MTERLAARDIHGHMHDVYFEVQIDQAQIGMMVRKAFNSKLWRAKDGPITVRVKAARKNCLACAGRGKLDNNMRCGACGGTGAAKTA